MDEDEFVVAAANVTNGMPEAFYDRAIAALSALDAKALITLEEECDGLSRAPCGPVLTSQAQFTITEKHQTLAKLLVETRRNLRVLYPQKAAGGVCAERSWIEGRKGATWLR
jgi:hypothetical protein